MHTTDLEGDPVGVSWETIYVGRLPPKRSREDRLEDILTVFEPCSFRTHPKCIFQKNGAFQVEWHFIGDNLDGEGCQRNIGG